MSDIIYSTSAQRRLEETAVALAPAFRDKFDFSDPKQHDEHAALSVLAAKALLRAIDKECGDRPSPVQPQAAEVKL